MLFKLLLRDVVNFQWRKWASCFIQNCVEILLMCTSLPLPRSGSLRMTDLRTRDTDLHSCAIQQTKTERELLMSNRNSQKPTDTIAIHQSSQYANLKGCFVSRPLLRRTDYYWHQSLSIVPLVRDGGIWLIFSTPQSQNSEDISAQIEDFKTSQMERSNTEEILRAQDITDNNNTHSMLSVRK